mmetsp:Transcript_18101/g.32830  ORF Transcript_18101/g.32830 Transcript_18101/m.32830 type:complete len:226 (-) Transcript_18101:112-789(-)
MTVCIAKLQHVGNDRHQSSTHHFRVSLKVGQTLITDQKRTCHMVRHNIGSSRNGFQRNDRGLVILIVHNLKGAQLGIQLEIKAFLRKIEATVATLDGGRFAATVDRLPGTGWGAVGMLSGSVVVYQRWSPRLCHDDTLVYFKVNEIRFGIPPLSTGNRILANDQKGVGLVKSTVGLFVHQHGSHSLLSLQVVEQEFTTSIDTHIRPGIMNGRSSTNLHDKDTVVI